MKSGVTAVKNKKQFIISILINVIFYLSISIPLVVFFPIPQVLVPMFALLLLQFLLLWECAKVQKHEGYLSQSECKQRYWQYYGRLGWKLFWFLWFLNIAALWTGFSTLVHKEDTYTPKRVNRALVYCAFIMSRHVWHGFIGAIAAVAIAFLYNIGIGPEFMLTVAKVALIYSALRTAIGWYELQ